MGLLVRNKTNSPILEPKNRWNKGLNELFSLMISTVEQYCKLRMALK